MLIPYFDASLVITAMSSPWWRRPQGFDVWPTNAPFVHLNKSKVSSFFSKDNKKFSNFPEYLVRYIFQVLAIAKIHLSESVHFELIHRNISKYQIFIIISVADRKLVDRKYLPLQSYRAAMVPIHWKMPKYLDPFFFHCEMDLDK